MFIVSLFLSTISFALIINSCLKIPSINIFIALNIFIAYLIRPILIYLNNGTILTSAVFNFENYLYGYFASSLFLLFFTIGICIGLKKPSNLSTLSINPTINTRYERMLLAATFVFTAFYLFIGGFDVLFTNRSASISIVNPFVRYIYPFAVVCMFGAGVSISLAMTLGDFKKAGLKLVFLFLCSTAIGQRGFLIVAIIIGFGLGFDANKRKILTSNNIYLGLLILVILFSKKIMTFLFSGGSNDVVEDDLMIKYLSSPDGDTTEVWMILMNYLVSNEFLFGNSIINNIFNLIPHTLRSVFGLLNGQDILNSYYAPDAYWEKGFGFNVTLPIEMYMNFGLLGAFPMLLVGILLGKVISNFYGAVAYNFKDPAHESLKLYGCFAVLSSFAGFQWFIVFLVVYFVYKPNKNAKQVHMKARN